MITVDKIDLSHYLEYARRINSVEQTYNALRLEQASAIPPHTQLINLQPRLEEIETVFGFRRYSQPWAHFTPPKNYSEQRRSPFAFDRVCPLLGSVPMLAAISRKVDHAVIPAHYSDSEKDQEEKKAESASSGQERTSILGCLKEIDKLNGLLHFVVARVGQFLQG